MTLEADQIVDRRRLRRKVTFWRVFSVLLIIVGLVGAGIFLAGPGGRMMGASGASIARIKIDGLIQSNQDRVEAIDRLARSSARAVIVRINSPGGTTAGSEELYDALVRLKARKPVVIVVDGLAASGAYIAALSGDYIVARETSLVGSIGVLFQYPNFYELLKTIGVQVEEIKSSPLKAAPNGFSPTSPEAKAAIESVVMDSYAWFKNLVQTNRKMDDPTLARVADGRIFTGRQAVGLKLVDEIGDERAALTWLATEKKIDPATPVRDYKLEDRIGNLSFLRLMGSIALDAVGLNGLARKVESWGALRTIESLNLDGLLALWHPSAAN